VDRQRTDQRAFHIEELAEGVFAAIGRRGTTSHSNAGIIDLGDRSVVIDTFSAPTPARALAAACEERTGRRASLVVITHGHGDHWGGNQAFPDAVIIGSTPMRTHMPKMVAWARELQVDPTPLHKEIAASQEILAHTSDPGERTRYEEVIAHYLAFLPELPTLEYRLPDVTFDACLTLHGSRRTLELHAVAAHTQSDVFAVLPTDGIVFCGDLGFFQMQPFMRDCDPQRWVAWLGEIEQSAHTVFVPGHGPVGTKKDLTHEREYIEALAAHVRQVAARGKPVESALALRLSPPFAAWQARETGRFEANVRALYGQLAVRKA